MGERKSRELEKRGGKKRKEASVLGERHGTSPLLFMFLLLAATSKSLKRRKVKSQDQSLSCLPGFLMEHAIGK